MARELRSLPFTALGVLTIAIFVIVEAIGPETRHADLWRVLVEVEKVLIIPLA